LTKQRAEPVALTLVQQLVEESQQEYDRVQQQLKEIDMLIQQTSGEVDRLSQRNAQATNRLKQLEMHFDTAPRSEIQEVYNAAQDAQKRLFMMRGQLEKLQSDQQNYQRYAQHLKRLLEAMGTAGPMETPAPATTQASGGTPTAVRIIEAQEQERQRLVRQMHDGPAQSLTNLILQAEICERLFDNDSTRARSELANLKNAVTSTFQKVRDLMFDLRPMMLDDLGLIPTLKRYVTNFIEKSSIPTNLVITGTEQRFAPYREVAIFRVIQELLTNARLHAHATQIQVTLDIADGLVRTTVEDNGSGFDPKEFLEASGQRKTIGLPTQRERVEMLGGKMIVESSSGRGTKVTVEMPLLEGEKV
jgi:two-component system, NarL family, sensor histidine kinase DegS